MPFVPRHLLSALGGLLSSLLVAGIAVAQPRTGILRGQVTDSASHPIALAEVTILSTDFRTLTDSLGHFQFDKVPVGVLGVIVRAIGWKPLFFAINLQPEQELIGHLGLERSPTRMPDLVVEGKNRWGKPAEYAFTTRYDDFFRRRRYASGTFRTKSNIFFRSSFHSAELLRGIPGVIVRFGMGGIPTVEFTGCSGANGKVSVWIDGAEVLNNDHNQALEYIRPPEIEMIEVYRRAGQIPGEFLGNSCAAVVIWSR